ncbi:MAG: CBS domain-containing protein [Treponema sp.]|nr:CBS domain-containing protein [Treponema sp.]
MQTVMDNENSMVHTSSEIVERILDGMLTGRQKPEHQPVMALTDGQIFVSEDGFGIKKSSYPVIGQLSRPGHCFAPDEKAESIYETMRLNPGITEFTVVEGNTAVGFLTRTTLNEILGGKYGFTLHSKNPIREIMKPDFLRVNYDMPVDRVSKLAMQRTFERLYNPIVVEHEGNYAGVVTVKDLLDTIRRMAVAERDEIALMRDNLKIGLFFMDRSFIIQDQYSCYLEELFSQSGLAGKSFIDLLASSVTARELGGIKDYFDMLLDRSFEQSMLDDLNPLTELHYAGKVFQCGFATIERKRGEVFALVSVYDITARVELQQRLTEEESRRHEEMKVVFELIHIEPQVFGDFLDDAEYEFERINEILKNDTKSAHEALVEVYQSVHAIKSNAVILGLNTFGNKVHNLESSIKKLRELEEVPFNDMLNISMELEKLFQEKDGLKRMAKKIKTFKSDNSAEGKNHKHSQGQYVLVESLTKTVDKVSQDMNKKIKFVVGEIDDEAIKKGPRRIMKEVLMQLIRNSAVHGIETPKERTASGKKEKGVIRLSIKKTHGHIHVKLEDNGRGLDYRKIAKKALLLGLIKKDDEKDKKALLKAVFSPGFSTAETEGIHAGRGIGLSLVKDRVRSIKGSIKLKTESGKGTTFNIIFPFN